MGKKLDKVKINKTTFESYFKEDLDAIEEELSKSKEYSQIIDNEIKKLSGPSLGVNKGGSHYLIEHLTNAVQLQTQRQGLRRDRFAIKKAILDYAAKFLDNDNSEGNEDMADLLRKFLDQNSANVTEATDSGDLDSDIDSILDEEK